MKPSGRSAPQYAAHVLVFYVIYGWIGAVQGHREYYRAAVYEHVRYNGNYGDSPKQIIQTNLRDYATAVETAANQEVDILVFPEWGLYPHNKSERDSLKNLAEDVPDPRHLKSNPCREEDLFRDSLILRKLSCLARDNKIFVVANMVDVKPCDFRKETCDKDNVGNCGSSTEKCHLDGRTYYNTNVVFDRKGNLVARYYKTHLYFENNFSTPTHPKPSFFETDFGNFTTFICFDMCYWESVEAVEKHGVWNVAFPTYWFDHFPLTLAIEQQQAWAITNNVNLLAANAHLPGTGSVGSGIYAGKSGALAYIFNPDGKSRLLISDVPMSRNLGNEPSSFRSHPILYVIEGGVATLVNYSEQNVKVPDQCSLKLLGMPQSLVKEYRCKEFFPAAVYATQKLEGFSGSLEVCQRDFCCSLTYEADSMDEEFHLSSFSILPSMLNASLGMCLKFCMLIRCNKGEDGRSCDTFPMSSSTSFRRVKLQGKFSSKYVYPIVLKSGMRLAPIHEWSHSITGGKSKIVFKPSSDGPHPVSTVALYERCYDGDIPFKTGNSPAV